MRTMESEEMYLETIYLLLKNNDNIRSLDVAEKLGYAKSSVSRAVSLLQKKGYIDVKKSGNIVLTKEGLDKSSGIYERHRIITKALIKIGAGDDIAEYNACRIEHVITDEMFEVIKKFEKTN